MESAIGSGLVSRADDGLVSRADENAVNAVHWSSSVSQIAGSII